MIGRVEWMTLAGTGLGAALGVGATLLGEQIRWRRTVRSGVLQDRQNMYVDCLVTLRRAHEAMRPAADEDHTDPLARAARIRQASEEYRTARQAHGDATRAARNVLRRDLTALEV